MSGSKDNPIAIESDSSASSDSEDDDPIQNAAPDKASSEKIFVTVTFGETSLDIFKKSTPENLGLQDLPQPYGNIDLYPEKAQTKLQEQIERRLDITKPGSYVQNRPFMKFMKEYRKRFSYIGIPPRKDELGLWFLLNRNQIFDQISKILKDNTAGVPLFKHHIQNGSWSKNNYPKLTAQLNEFKTFLETPEKRLSDKLHVFFWGLNEMLRDNDEVGFVRSTTLKKIQDHEQEKELEEGKNRKASAQELPDNHSDEEKNRQAKEGYVGLPEEGATERPLQNARAAAEAKQNLEEEKIFVTVTVGGTSLTIFEKSTPENLGLQDLPVPKYAEKLDEAEKKTLRQQIEDRLKITDATSYVKNRRLTNFIAAYTKVFPDEGVPTQKNEQGLWFLSNRNRIFKKISDAYFWQRSSK